MGQLEDPVFLDTSFQLIEHYRKYPELAAEDLLRVILSDVQKVILKAMWEKNYVLTIMTRGGGKTFLLGVFAVLKALLYPGHRIGLLAPTFRQSKMIFDECEKLWNASPVFQTATSKPPVKGADNCYINFKSVGGFNPSIIQAIPLGDGTKIRGSRFYTIVCDEFPHIPSDIFNMVIRPMGATSSNPMARVMKIEQQEKLLKLGLISQEEAAAEEESTNQIIITSSGYFTFNHMYTLYCIYKEEIRKGNSDKYAVFRVPHWLLPRGFLDKDNVESARSQMSSLEFRMEYEAAFIPDTESIFRASLLESCSNTSFTPQLYGTPGKNYILGVDPARSEDSFAVVIVELGQPCKVVNAIELQKVAFPKMGQLIENLCRDYEVTAIYMDSQGGGLAIKDIIAQNQINDPRGPILDLEDEIHLNKKGRHILHLCAPSVNFISESNFAALRLLEHQDLLFPSVPREANPSAAQDEAWQTILRMKAQMQAIDLTETSTGKQHFDLPRGENSRKTNLSHLTRKKKDLYSAFILASWGAYQYLWTEELPESVITHTGVMKPRDNIIQRGGFGSSLNTYSNIPDVIREKLEIATDPDAYKRNLLLNQQSKRTIIFDKSAVLKPKLKKR